MLFHMIDWDPLDPKIKLTFAVGKSVTYRPGEMASSDGRALTADDIHLLIREYNKEVRNNIKNSKAPLTDRAAQDLKNWEEAHPGEKAPEKWNLSLNFFDDDPDSDMDRSDIMVEVSRGSYTTADYLAAKELLYKLPKRQRMAYLLVHYAGCSYEQAGEEMGCSKANVAKLVGKAERNLAKYR